MSSAYCQRESLDDLMRWVFHVLLKEGETIYPTKGSARELTGVTLELTNPLARLSRTESRGRPFSCLGELCWYLAKTDDLHFIEYYLSAYKKFADGDKLLGAYGPRLYDWRGIDQMSSVGRLLETKQDTRQAVVQLFDSSDLTGEQRDVPCTCTLQFLLRKGKLHLIAHMRSNDAYLGLPHDIFCFTMLQEIMARSLSAGLGTYKHVVGSLHLYERDITRVEEFLSEGWQSTQDAMPPMPCEPPNEAIAFLLAAEQTIRDGEAFDTLKLEESHPYWADLVRLLLAFRARRENDGVGIEELRGRMTSRVYDTFLKGLHRRTLEASGDR